MRGRGRWRCRKQPGAWATGPSRSLQKEKHAVEMAAARGRERKGHLRDGIAGLHEKEISCAWEKPREGQKIRRNSWAVYMRKWESSRRAMRHWGHRCGPLPFGPASWPVWVHLDPKFRLLLGLEQHGPRAYRDKLSQK